ncbi:PD-(D/E)XK nuclease family protein [Candidatus Cardinium hertigii]|jgi:hypothetical protein|uniref:PD-(D/E)XK nuclease family protein n=1 Tax=Candidatus Cardinium hertigii TaxID=247481 RepID=A0A3N2QBD8_9BACT|nr:PD-(D/E)XK nuclease family protein [Candidatus Cardinium hertigii]ROT47123.1 PD-(D/E)XK nuclease family protein [Candidatus Cardinium hertigii]
MKTVTHQPFLAQVMQQLHTYGPNTLEQCLLVFPTQLSIDYFQPLLDKLLNNRAEWESGRLPTCLTLHQLMLTHSKMDLAHPFILVRELHALAHEILNKKETFEQFYPWGITLLQDFNYLDTYLIHAADLFLALMHQKQLTTPLEIRNFLDQNPLLQQAMHLSLFQKKEVSLFWEKLPLLYQAFTQNLIQQGKGYEGLCYRIASEKSTLETIISYQKIMCIGFNLLSPAEEQFIVQCKAVMPVVFFWDADAHYVDNEMHVAGYYLRKYRQKKCFQESFPAALETYFNDGHKKIVITEMGATVAEVQAVVDALQEKTEQGVPKFLPTQTAIVISGTYLLMPLLDRLSSLPMQLHCRLNYPLSATVIYTLIEKLVHLWEQSTTSSAKICSGISSCSCKHVMHNLANSLALLHPFVETSIQAKITAILKWIPNFESDLGAFIDKLGLFSLWLDDYNKGLLHYLYDILSFLDNHFIHDHTLFLDLNRTALQHILAYIAPLIEVVGDSCTVRCLLQALKESTMLFHQHNPMTGLYIIEVSQSHNLDFEHIFFMDMREGAFPRLSHENSFLPYNIRNNFGLPLAHSATERITAYGFYRLLQRAQSSYCSYTKQTHLGIVNQRSRFLLQLTFGTTLKIIEKQLPVNFTVLPTPVISIEKDDKVMQLLEKFLVKEDLISSNITPSALMSYLHCPLQFYFSYLLELKQTVLPKDGTTALELGTLLHHIMEKLYRPFIGIKVDKSIVMQLQSKIQTVIQETVPLGSDSHLSSALLEKLLERVLQLDYADTPFTLLGVEVGKKEPMAMVLDLDIDKKRQVCLSGIIDRIDIKGDTIRIIDYKIGASNSKIVSMAALFDSAAIKKNKAIFQLVFYAWLYNAIYGANHQQGIMPYLINIRELFSAPPGICMQQPDHAKKYGLMEDIRPYLPAFEEQLLKLLLEIFDPTIPFRQTADLSVCSYCPYVRICQRD